MQICLITPPSPFLLDERVFPALGILKVAAVLELAGHQVDHLDLCGVLNPEQVVRDYVGASVFGVTATTPQIPSAIRIALTLRERASVKTILGGPHATLVHAAAKRGNERAQQALDLLLSHFDVVVAGDGEKAIFMALHSRGVVDADDPKSILWNTSKDFDESPWPARHLVDMESYHYKIDGVKATSAVAQLGCLTAETPIVLSSGYEKPISEIQPGEEVLCFDESLGRITSFPVEQTFKREADDIWEIEWGNGQKLLITGEHPIFTGKGWKTIQEIEVGGVSAYLRGMRYEFSSQIESAVGEVLQEEMQGRVAKVSSQSNVAACGAGESTSALRSDDAGSETTVLYRGPQQPPAVDSRNSRETIGHKAGQSQPYEAPRSGRESIEDHQRETRENIFGEVQEDVEGREARAAYQWPSECVTEWHGEATSGDSVQRSSPILLRRKWGFLDRPLQVRETSQSRLYWSKASQGDSSPRGILAPRGRLGSGTGLLEQRMDPVDNLDEGTQGGESDEAYRKAALLWSSIRSKRFIGRGTVYNITVHPGHNYFANGMLVHNCPFHCSFCGGRNSPMLRQIRVRTNGNAVDEMMHLHEKYGISGIMHFQDELNISHKRVIEMMAMMKDTGIEWKQRGFVKAELFNEEQAEAMYAAGFRWLMCGFEAAHPRILNNIAKNATVEDNTRMIRIAHKHGIKVKALMSAGHPGESEETILATRDWLLEEKPDDFDVTIITVYPGTPYYDESVCIGDPVYKYVTNGDALYSENTDFHKDMQFYKGAPHAYKSYVWSDFISRERLCELRDDIEDEVRTKLSIPYATGAAAVNYDHSMGMTPQILRSSIAGIK